ncbi:hypothetical protein [Methylotenera sp.]|uniref:hypothetical protein n=1 Tax=Methylotenera sp. TaxID=2051956 RepID=UPI002EDAD54B
MKFIMLISLTLLMTACDDQEAEKLKQEQDKAAVEALITIPPQTVVLPQMKNIKGHAE